MNLSVPVEKWIAAGISFPTEYNTEHRSSYRPKPANSECPAVRIVSSKKRTPHHMYLY
ncbi:Protein CBG21280 [Caenorhabditis briggsae]|nr:Protein CBG21280 [Caenorhabditis briggsae]CAP38132.3 Protein CBG21280 [Caenorhabditis briggsae]